MFVLKWKADNGSETVYVGKDISFTPAAHSDNGKAMVTFYNEEGTFCSFDEGTIFVMNDLGKTVADYRLSYMNDPRLAAAA